VGAAGGVLLFLFVPQWILHAGSKMGRAAATGLATLWTAAAFVGVSYAVWRGSGRRAEAVGEASDAARRDAGESAAGRDAVGASEDEKGDDG